MAPKPPRTPEEQVSDSASLEALAKALAEGTTTCFARADAQPKPCTFGVDGLCCRICHMGPCRITPKNPVGVCGANQDTIVARNYLREVASGAAAHSDHGRHLALLLRRVAEGRGGSYAITDDRALRQAATKYGLPTLGRPNEQIALDLADCFLGEFTKQQQKLQTLTLAPLPRQTIWNRQAVEPLGVDRMIVECLHRTNMGVDHDYRNILQHAMRTALADGGGGSRIATMASDILFGTPRPIRSQANLGVLAEDRVNVLVHGHEPALSEMLAVVSNDPEVKAAAREVGAEGVTLAGICCTANEILMRHGISVAGNLLQQELAIVTGAVEMMLVDVQCVMPSLPDVAAAYHTEIVSTSEIARTAGATHVPFDEDSAYACAKDLLLRAIANYPRRDRAKMAIPRHKQPVVAGFSVAAIEYMLGGRHRASFRPLNDAIIAGRIHGIAGIVGCNNPKQRHDDYTNTLTAELLQRDVLVVKTGCAAIASAKAGMLTPEAALSRAGPGLREVCEAVGMPPVLHMGSCVDCSRILEAGSEIVAEGGLGDDLADLPAVGIAPEWMSEKAVSIGSYFVASGVDVILGHPFHIGGSENVTRFLNHECRERYGASFHVHEDPQQASDKVMQLLGAARKKLGIDKRQERKLFDMKDRRKAHG